MNTLIINIVERTGEIGTMRALGAERKFVRRIFLAETLLLNVAASLVGIAVGLAMILAAGRAGLRFRPVSQFLIGGGNLPLLLSPWPFVVALSVVVAVSVCHTPAHPRRHPHHAPGRHERPLGGPPCDSP